MKLLSKLRYVPVPFILIGSIIIIVLFLNDETSVKNNMKYDAQINELKAQIKLNQDSAEYYKRLRTAIEEGESDLEKLARERFHMQKPTEDVYIYE